MSVEKQGTVVSVAGGTPTTKYRFGKRIGATPPQTVVPCNVLGEAADGVIRNTVTATGDAIGLQLDMISFVELGALCTLPATGKLAVTTDALGKAIPAVTSGHKINGFLLESGVAGDFRPVELIEGPFKPSVP